MTTLRRLLHMRPGIAAALVTLALAMKLLVPAGFMPSVVQGGIVVSICTGTGPATMVVDMPGMAHQSSDDTPRHDEGAGAPCAYAGLLAPSLVSVDPLLLSVALLVAMALALRPAIPPLAAVPVRLRPPLRGPPRPA